MKEKEDRGNTFIYRMSALCQKQCTCVLTESASLRLVMPHFTEREKEVRKVQVACLKLQVVKWLS